MSTQDACKSVELTLDPRMPAGHPVVLCTDDSGVFSTSLSQEYEHARQGFHLTSKDLLALANASIDHSFATPAEKRMLKERVLVVMPS